MPRPLSVRWRRVVPGALVLLPVAIGLALLSAAGPEGLPAARVPRTADFELTGDGSAAPWAKAAWIDLDRRPGGELPYTARVKLLYSATGFYVLFEGTDERITASLPADYLKLWTEDVFEVFLWTDARHPVYFEYEISPLGNELPLLIPNFDGNFFGWIPWQYEGGRKVRKRTTAIGGEAASGAKVSGWRAEVFIPYELLKPLAGVPPVSGSRWRANFYRVDYDGTRPTAWDWARVGPSFHEYEKFGTLELE